jgi:hypothetical protein
MMGSKMSVLQMRTNCATLILSFAMPLLACGQMRNANWLLSNYWISFSNGVPENLPPSPYYLPAASLSDTTGELLVYYTVNSSGQSTGVRGADHELLQGNPPYEGVFSGGNMQSVIFIPKPNDPERAFLIAWNRVPSLGIQRFGWLEAFLGDGVAPPQVLSTEYTWFMTGAACRRMVVPHANGEDYWFIGQMAGTNEYHAYVVSSTGLSSAPIISAAGSVVPLDFDHGKLIPTVDGTRFAAISETYGFTEPTVAPSLTEVHSFDPGSGAVQHEFALDAPVRVDGVEFSPSGRYLYVMHWLYDDPVITHELYQYDLQADDPNLAPVLMDEYEVGGLSGITTNILSHAPDGRIYVSHYVPSMGVISAPDQPYPQCAYEHDGFLASVGPQFLPAVIKRYNDPPVIGPLGTSDRPAMQATATVLPNPLQGAGELRLPGATGPVVLQWLDAQGRLVRNITTSAFGERVSLDADGLATGHYLLRVQAGEMAPVLVRVSVER